MNTSELPKYYTTLFAAVEDALEAMEQHNFGTAKQLLIQALQKAEELYLEEN